MTIQLNKERESNVTDFGLAVLKDRYLIGNETSQDLFARVAKAYSNNDAHAQRIYDYISKMWFMPATPILAMVECKIQNHYQFLALLMKHKILLMEFLE